jgi:ankyrin repeat protein
VRLRAVFAIGALLLATVAPASAQSDASEPSARVCDDFRAQAERTLATEPDSLQINNLLFDAARKGCVRSLERLTAAGASRLARDREGDNALSLAARNGRLSFIEALIAGASTSERRQIDAPDAHGATPLLLAAKAGRTDVAKRLIEAGADIGAIDASGQTALSAAVYADNAEIAALLLSHGAKADSVDRSGKAVICYAAARGSAQVVAKLIEAGVDVNARYRADLTALMWAAGHADTTPAARVVETIKWLLAHGAKLDLTDDRGRDALMIASSLNHVDAARTLREAGASPDARDKTGKSALDLATSEDMRAALK